MKQQFLFITVQAILFGVRKVEQTIKAHVKKMCGCDKKVEMGNETYAKI